jgi:ATP-binding cassette subfamily F protein uup
VSVISAHDLVKAFGAERVLDVVSVTIEEGERVGLVGLNGSGKSTLARVLAGVETVDGGEIARRRGAKIAYLDQDPKFEPQLSPRQVVTEGLAAWAEAKRRHEDASHALTTAGGDVDVKLAAQTNAAADVERLGGWDREHEVETVLHHVGIASLDARMDSLSGGDRRRVALARILVARPDLAVLDEPSNHLDVETIEWLESHLIDTFTGAVLLITHDRALLDHVALRTLELDKGKLHTFDGGYVDYLMAKADRQAHEARTEANRQNFLRKEVDWLRRQPRARSTKQKARIQRAETALSVSAPVAEKAALFTLDATRAGKTILDFKGVTLAPYGKPLVSGLDFSLVAGERVGVVGKNGTGKTTLIKAVLGELEATKGQIVVGKITVIAYFDQHRANLEDEKSVYENVADGRSRVDVGGQQLDVRGYLERFLFSYDKQRQPVGSLSGGERARAALAKILSRGANLVILDEPTNDLDTTTLAALEDLLTDLDGSALVVTHDRWFLNRVATSVLAFEGDGRVVRYAGGYDAYREQRGRADAERAEAEQARAAPRPSQKPPAPTASAKGKLSFNEKRELEGLLDLVDRAETEVKDLETKLADPDLYATRGAEVPALSEALAKKRTEAAKLVARWEELEAKREG